MTTPRHASTGCNAIPAWKIEPPRLADTLLARERLSARIEQCLGKDRASGDVFLLSAPAGYGKTTMLAQWAASASVSVAWYHLDAGDNDPVALLLGIASALRSRLPHSVWEVERMLARVRGGALAPTEVRRATDVLIGDIAREVRKPLALALTGVSELGVRSGGHAVLDRLLARPADHLRLAIESREAPKLRLSPLLTQRRLDGLGAEELRLREDELTALLALHEMPLDAQQTEALHILCDGWVTGVLLATDALLPECIPSCFGLEFNREAVFDYLASEVIEALPPVLSEFATQVSILRQMTPSLCARLLDREDAREPLGALEKRTGFVSRVGHRPEELIYRFQPLLRQALLERLEAEDGDPARRRHLHLRAGELLEESGELEEAAHQYAEAAAFERLAALIEARHGSLLRAGRGDTLARWLGMLPPAVREGQPHLQVLLAEMHRQAGRFVEALAAAERACKVCRPLMKREPALMARALVTRAAGRFTQARYHDAREDCEDAIRCAPCDADEIHVQARFILASCLQALMGSGAAADCLDGVEERATRRRDLWALARLHYLRSKLAIAQGNYAEAEREATAALLAAQEDGDEVDAINSRLNLGMVKRVTRRPLAARDDLEAARAQAEAAGYALGQAYAYSNLADVELDTGNYERALESYQRANALAEGVAESQLHTYAHAGIGYALVLAGQVAEAESLLDPLLAECSADERAMEWLIYALPAGLAYLRAGRLDEAAELLTTAGICAQTHGVSEEFARARLYLATVELARSRMDAAAEALRTALDAAARASGSDLLLVEARRLPELWPLLGESGHPVAAELRRALDASASAPETPSEPRESEAEAPIRAFALADERVLVGVEHVTRWRMPRARELLFFLLDRGEPVRKDVVLEKLFPEKEPEVAEIAFRQARFQLNKALGRPCLAQTDGRWHLAVEVWLDVREFERLADESERLASEGELSAAATVLRQALTYYTDPYLANTYRDWADERRDALARRHLACLERLADLERRLGRAGNTAQIYYQILDIEPHRESAHRGLMTYFAERGEPAEALAQFKRCVGILSRDLNLPPDPATLSLADDIYQRIQSGMRAFTEAAKARQVATIRKA